MNKQIVIAAGGITAIGIANAWLQHKPITRILVGGYVLALTLSLFDLLGGQVSAVAGAVAMLALITVVLTQFDWIGFYHQMLNPNPATNSQNAPSGGGGAHPTSH